jgi:hypothetical protein
VKRKARDLQDLARLARELANRGYKERDLRLVVANTFRAVREDSESERPYGDVTGSPNMRRGGGRR